MRRLPHRSEEDGTAAFFASAEKVMFSPKYSFSKMKNAVILQEMKKGAKRRRTKANLTMHERI